MIALSATAAFAANLPQTRSAEAAAPARPAVRSAQAPAYQPPVYTAPAPMVSPAQTMLDSRIKSLGRSFNGDVGIAVKDLQTGWTSHYDGASLFPQQSVSKFWVALTALDKADRGELDLNAPVTVRNTDLTLFHQPIRALIKGDGYKTTVGDLMYRAITQSDNTANDFVLRRAGGPDAVHAFFARKNVNDIRFGPGERLLQSALAGLSWQPHYSFGNGFYAARSKLPMATRQAAFNRYTSNPMDGATPLGIVEALGRLKRGDLLSPASTSRLLSTMSNTKTGAQRLKGGLAPGWRLAHKTGTGQVLGGVQTGYNDIGIVTAPDGRAYSVAVMIRKTTAPIPQRMAVMQNTVRAIADYHRNLQSYNYSGGAMQGGRAGSE